MTSNKEIPSGFRWTTYAERLEKAGVSWKVYQQQDNYGCNMLENFKAFQQADQSSPLYLKGMVREPEGQVRIRRDATTSCPPSRGLSRPARSREHPDFMPAAGAAFVASKIDAIAANPEVWAKTAFILNYDENDGIFDHVAPPVPPPGTPKEFIRRSADRRRLSRSVHHRFALDRRRLGVQPAVRPYVGAAIAGKIHRRAPSRISPTGAARHSAISRPPSASMPTRPIRQNFPTPATGSAAPNTKWPISPSRNCPVRRKTPPKQEKGSRKRVPRVGH